MTDLNDIINPVIGQLVENVVNTVHHDEVCVAVWGSVVCCSVLQCFDVCCSVLQCVAVCRSVLQ